MNILMFIVNTKNKYFFLFGVCKLLLWNLKNNNIIFEKLVVIFRMFDDFCQIYKLGRNIFFTIFFQVVISNPDC